VIGLLTECQSVIQSGTGCGSNNQMKIAVTYNGKSEVAHVLN
jgi:hypothetical protein